MTASLRWFVDEIVTFRRRVWLAGWVHDPDREIAGLSVAFPDGDPVPVARWRLASPAAVEEVGAEAGTSGFAIDLPAPDGRYADELALEVRYADGTVVRLVDLHGPATDRDPYHRIERSFWERLGGVEGDVLEVGSRNRSGPVRRGQVGDGRRYVGFDILEGPNVDVVGDAHELSRHFPARSFAAVFAVATFEHLVMPWKAVLEINKVLAPGGIVWVATHQTYPLHEIPWDFYRYSNDGWRGLFNPSTGFAILEVGMGEPAAVVATRSHSLTRDMDAGQAYLGAAVIAQKIGDTALTWPVRTEDVVGNVYPQ
jgi:SAM-dependent methyltransferase